jgi:hypothetical protein
MVSISLIRSVSIPASSLTSRTAVSWGDSPGSTIPFGNCHLNLGLIATIAISGSESFQRKATPPPDLIHCRNSQVID